MTRIPFLCRPSLPSMQLGVAALEAVEKVGEAAGIFRTIGATAAESIGNKFGLPTNARELNDRVIGYQKQVMSRVNQGIDQVRQAGQKRLRLVPRPAGMSLNDYVKKSRIAASGKRPRASRPVSRPAKRVRFANPTRFNFRPARVGNYRGSRMRYRKKWKRRVRRARRRW